MRGSSRVWLVAMLLAAATAGCGMFGNEEERLEGERRSVRSTVQEDNPTIAGAEAPLPPPQALLEWTQTSANAAHNGGHIAGGSGLARSWSVDAGEGGDGRITSAPIVVGGQVIALDGAAQLSSFSAGSGARSWTRSLAPVGEDGEDGFGGGLAAEGGTIFATTGFGEVLAIRAGSGEILWRQGFGAPFRAGPAVANGVIIAVSRDNQAFALSTVDGRVLWRLQGAAAGAGLLGGASPALAGQLAVVPFASGELVGVARDSGRRVWAAVLSGGRRGQARSAIADVSGDPVVVGPLVVAANQAGRIIAVEGQTGRRVWTRSIGSTGPLWAAGGNVFVMGDDGTLARLSAETGASVWEVPLPVWRNSAKWRDPISYSGPVLVGGRVLVADDQGTLHAFDAASGGEAGGTDIGDGSVLQPVAAGGMVYVLSTDGTLYAFR